MAMAMGVTITSATAATMSTDARRYIGAAVVGGLGLLSIGLSLPRIMAYSYLAMVPSGVSDALKSGRQISVSELEVAQDVYLKAHSYLSEDAVITQDLGRLELRRAAALRPFPGQRDEALEKASAYFRETINAAPARSFPWGLEAYTRWERSEDPGEINKLLRMSYFLGPHEASSILVRARVGTQIWDQLDKDVRQFTSDDLVAIWSEGRLRTALIPIYLEASLPTRVAIRKLLLVDKPNEQRFDQMLKRAVSSPKQG